MIHLRRYFTQRAPLLGLSAFCGILSTLGQNTASTHDEDGLVSALSKSSERKSESFVWEPSRGVLGDYFFGRPILFEARDVGEEEDSPRDIFRAFVTLSPEGRVVDVSRVHNLTATSRADEFSLRGNDSTALFATRTKKAPPSLSFLNLSGEHRPKALPLLARLQLNIAAYLETGTASGLGRSDLFLPLAKEGDSLGVVIEGDQANLHAGEAEASFTTAELFSPGVVGRSNPDQSALYFTARTREPAPWPHFFANAGRSLLGVPAIAWLEGRLFSTQDWLQRMGYSLRHGVDVAPQTPDIVLPETPSSTGAAADESEAEVAWPPTDLKVSTKSHKGDGIWREVRRKVLPTTKDPLFYRTVLHPDPERPYAELHLVAMDMRRLELGMGAGYEDPHPDTGPPGSGQLPADPELASRVVATFNGAFKAAHGRYGMKAEGRLLVEPVEGAATVAVDSVGRVGFGTWGPENDESDYIALRQNLDPLIANGVVNPHERTVWGDHLYGSGVAVERSALCLHESGQLIYAWGVEATGETLARGLQSAGCSYAMHLDMNPGHCAFLFNKVTSIRPLHATGETLDRRMRVNPTRFIRWSPKDFFYLARRREIPKNDKFEWFASSGNAPEPKEIPALLSGELKLGELSIALERVDLTRLSFFALPGSEESRKWGDQDPIEAPAEKSALISWGLGHQTRGARAGLSDGAQVIVPLKRSLASLIIEHGQLQLLPPSEALSERASAQIVQLPLLARDGTLVPEATQLGGSRERSALCVHPDGHLLIARMRHDTPSPLAQALLDQGCSLVVEMDRGSHPPPLVQRAGTEHPPTQGHHQTMLYGRALPMRPQSFSF